MNDMVSVGGKLALICAVAAIALGLVNAVTAPAIARVKEEQLAAALDKVRGTADAGAEQIVEGDPVVKAYYALNDGGASAGFILKLLGIGYAGDMELLASIAADGEIRLVALMDNLETPGLGKEAEKPEYMEKYIGTGSDRIVPLNKQQLTQTQADSIAGASITFMGLAQALVAGSDYVKEQLGK
jgi:Na+-translocating ferredoxin:NAD+ oxidoreductase subunit G